MKLKDLFKPLIKLCMYVFRIFPIKKDKIVFSSFSARSYSDNPKYIAEEILKENYKWDCVFILQNPNAEILPEGIRKVKYNTLRYLYEMATAKVWVDNTRKQSHIIKRKKQKYLQTWHAAISFKRVEKDAEDALAIKYVKTAKNDSKMIDILTTNSNFGEKLCKRAFWYNGKVVKTGTPRVDIFIKDNIQVKEDVKNKLKIDSSTNILLYAPTFRKDGNINCYNIDYDNLKKVLEKKFGGKWIITVRLHPNIRTSELNLPEYVLNLSMYPDINELFCAVDILITDYSTTMMEFPLTQRPVFIYASDIENYMNDRNSYFRFDELPYSVSENNEQLINNILCFDEIKYKNELKKFFEKLNIIEDGNASKRVVQIIREFIEEK